MAANLDDSFDICLDSSFSCDERAYVCWLEGKSVDETKSYMIRQMDPEENGAINNLFSGGLMLRDNLMTKYNAGRVNFSGLINNLLLCSIKDQFKYFDIIEDYLHNPSLLLGGAKHQHLQLNINYRDGINILSDSCLKSPMAISLLGVSWNVLIQRYYAIENENALKESLFGIGKKHARTRKDLMEQANEFIEEKIAVGSSFTARKFIRQFENVKRLQRGFEEFLRTVGPINIVEYLEIYFFLSPALSKTYACIISLLSAKFSFAKKRFLRLSLPDLEACGAITCSLLHVNHDKFIEMCVFVLNSGDENVVSIHDIMRFLLQGSVERISQLVWLLFSTFNTNEVNKNLSENIGEMRKLLSLAASQSGVGTLAEGMPVSRELSSAALASDPSSSSAALSGAPPTNADALDVECSKVATRLRSIKCYNVAKVLSSHGRMRAILKALLSIGSQISQGKEYKDFLEDLLVRIIEPLEELGLNKQDLNHFLLCCGAIVPPEEASPGSARYQRNTSSNAFMSLPSRGTSEAEFVSREWSSGSAVGVTTGGSASPVSALIAYGDMSKRQSDIIVDWLRFVVCCRLCVAHLVNVE